LRFACAIDADNRPSSRRENHRAWVMERIGARNVAELVRIAMQVRMQA
jgi:FixJ family two-component response regulator